jgi:peptidyl-tRNA hydrolase, PTH1 family
MGLFDRKRTDYTDSQPLYSIGFGQSLLVMGLGNVGKEYAGTRHNIGFEVLDYYRTTHDFSGWVHKSDLKCHLSTGNVGSTRVLLVKPTTYMNLSGECLQTVQAFYKLTNADTLVVHDELDLEFGTLRTRSGGSSAGHNGIKSLLSVGDDSFSRVRIGIGPKTPEQMEAADYVLQQFSVTQKEKLPKIIREACSLIDERTAGPLTDLTLNIG